MPQVLIALGSNLGDRQTAIQRALDALSGEIRWETASRIYETAPMYVEDQPAFFNAAALGETELGPLALLSFLKATERAIGRHPAARFGPREIDIDLISYGQIQLQSTRDGRELILPHPRSVERRFVLAPLADLGGGLQLPGFGSVDELLIATNEQAKDVRMVTDAVLSLRRERSPR